MGIESLKGILAPKQGDASSTGAVRAYNSDKDNQVAFNLEDFSKKGFVPGYADVSIHTQNQVT